MSNSGSKRSERAFHPFLKKSQKKNKERVEEEEEKTGKEEEKGNDCSSCDLAAALGTKDTDEQRSAISGLLLQLHFQLLYFGKQSPNPYHRLRLQRLPPAVAADLLQR